MATTTPLPPSGPPPTGSPPSPSSSSDGSASNSLGSSNIPPVSLVLYIFSVTLILLLLVLAAFISRTVRRRRRRNATVLAALTTGANGPSTGLRGKFDGLSASKPVLWESHIAPVNEDAKGWADIFPVAGVTMVPVEETPADDVMFRRLTTWPSRLRFSSRRSRDQPPIVEDASPTLPSTEPPPPPPEPVHLTVLISMPTPFSHTKAGLENGGPPVVELGVAEVAYTPNVTQ